MADRPRHRLAGMAAKLAGLFRPAQTDREIVEDVLADMEEKAGQAQAMPPLVVSRRQPSSRLVTMTEFLLKRGGKLVRASGAYCVNRACPTPSAPLRRNHAGQRMLYCSNGPGSCRAGRHNTRWMTTT